MKIIGLEIYYVVRWFQSPYQIIITLFFNIKYIFVYISLYLQWCLRLYIFNVDEYLCYCSGSLEQSLKDGLQKFSNARRYEYWSQYVKSLVCHVAEMEEEGICYFTEAQMLISAWRMLLILSTNHVCSSTHNHGTKVTFKSETLISWWYCNLPSFTCILSLIPVNNDIMCTNFL